MDFPFAPERASSMAGQVDLLFYGLVALTLAVLAIVFVPMFYFLVHVPQGQRRGPHAARFSDVEGGGHVVGDPVHDRHGHLPVEFGNFPAPENAAAGRGRVGGQRHRQTMDVERPASRGQARTQRTARPARAHGAPDNDLARRDPRFRGARVSHEGRRGAGAVHLAMVQGDEDGKLPFVLRSTLRHGARADGRLGHGDDAVRLPDVGSTRAARRRRWWRGGSGCIGRWVAAAATAKTR